MTTPIKAGKRIVQALRYKGFVVELVEGRIRYGAGHKPSDAEREEVRANREAVVAFLSSEPPRKIRSCYGACPKCGAFEWQTPPGLTCLRCGYVVPSLFGQFCEERTGNGLPSGVLR